MDSMCNTCQVSKLNSCLTEQKQILSPKQKTHKVQERQQECFFDAETMYSSEFLSGSGRYDHLTQKQTETEAFLLSYRWACSSKQKI